ncbi:hypothetical protein B0H14DRAFT_153541 [Mycena olivaceomarginata]|nr:hypothetical protein B0H14DRAFT_153541 [Mycena olivaceomarginata]
MDSSIATANGEAEPTPCRSHLRLPRCSIPTMRVQCLTSTSTSPPTLSAPELPPQLGHGVVRPIRACGARVAAGLCLGLLRLRCVQILCLIPLVRRRPVVVWPSPSPQPSSKYKLPSGEITSTPPSRRSSIATTRNARTVRGERHQTPNANVWNVA